MLPKFVKFIVAYLILLTWLFNVGSSNPFCSKAKYSGPISIRCNNPASSGKKYFEFEYNKNVVVDLTNLRDVINAENFGIYIVGHYDVEALDKINLIHTALIWAKNNKSSVCVVKDTELNHGFFGSVIYRLTHVGEVVGEFLVFLENQGLISIKKTTAAGFSLGAHMISEALKYVQKLINKKAPILIALDPPRWVRKSKGVTKAAAEYVQMVLSSLYSSGQKDAHAIFRLNGSIIQPGCARSDLNCSHMYALSLFEDTIDGTKQFFGINKKDKNKTCLFGIYNVDRESGDFYIKYETTPHRVDLVATIYGL